MLLSIRKAMALAICPELKGLGPSEVTTGRDQILLGLIDAHQERCALSDWEVATQAGVNNRAVFLLRDGKRVTAQTVCALYEFLWMHRDRVQPWPVSEIDEERFFRLECVPALERIGGVQVAHDLVVKSGRSRSLNSVQTWSRRGVPGYGRLLIDRYARAHGVELDDDDFSIVKVRKADLDRIRAMAILPKNRRVA